MDVLQTILSELIGLYAKTAIGSLTLIVPSGFKLDGATGIAKFAYKVTPPGKQSYYVSATIPAEDVLDKTPPGDIDGVAVSIAHDLSNHIQTRSASTLNY